MKKLTSIYLLLTLAACTPKNTTTDSVIDSIVVDIIAIKPTDSIFTKSFSYENPYKLPLVDDTTEYRNSLIANPEFEFVDLRLLSPKIDIDMRYASDNNFTGKRIYTSTHCILRKEAADALKLVQLELNKQALGLIIYDAYRPYNATLEFYNICSDLRYVAAPWRGSVHNRGCAVDVSLIDLDTKKELQMPTAFDEFSIHANPNYDYGIDSIALVNRNKLIDVMSRYGFTVNIGEWWHYDFQNAYSYPLTNIPAYLLIKEN